MRQYRFRVLVTLAPAGRGGPGLRLPNRMRALTAHACCLIQPARHREYFPAVICPDEELPPSAAHAMMTIALADGEAEAFFALGRCFTLWADGTVGRTVRAEGLVGYGVICARQSPPLLSNDSGGIRRKTAVPGAVSRRKPDVRPAMPAR